MASTEGPRDQSTLPGGDVDEDSTGNNRSKGQANKSMDKSTPTTSGPDSDAGSVDELPPDEEEEEKKEGQVGVTEELSHKVTAGASYIGSMFSTAWTKTAKTANDATAGSSSFLSTAFNKVTTTAGSAKTSPKEENKPVVQDDTTSAPEASNNDDINNANTAKGEEASSDATSSFFSSAWNKVGGFTKSASSSLKPATNDESANATTTTPDEKTDPTKDERSTTTNAEETATSKTNFFSSFSTKFSKVATDATSVIKDKVSTSMIGEFNKEQDEFIKSKGNDVEVGLAPWVGYQEEEAMKAKILSLSDDKRNFVRAPPSGVTFEFDYASVSSVALALLHEDDKLEKMRYELVPKTVKEDEFWRNYFYRVNLIKQSFDLKDLEASGNSKSTTNNKPHDAGQQRLTSMTDEDVNAVASADPDDEFVSDSYQASSKDIDEVNESMKRLGVGGNEAEEWEAELEGELNEFEVVSSKDGREEDTNSPEWENQIQEMLDAEDGLK